MFVNEEIVRCSEERADSKGVDTAAAAAAANEGVEIDLSEFMIGPEVAGAVVAQPDFRKVRVPLARPARRFARPTPQEFRRRLRHASFSGAVLSKAEVERFIGANDLVDENYLERALIAARAVCRLNFRDLETGRQAFATGFMVAPRLLITNWHVFPTEDAAQGALAEFEYKLDIRGNEVMPTRFRIRPDIYHHSNQELDFALVALDPTSHETETALVSFGYHRLVEARGKLTENEPITIIQHPAGGRRQVALRENELIKEPTEDDLFLWYRSDTARGSSGAPAFNDSWQIVALHHSGKARKENGMYVLRDGRRVASLKGIEESNVDWIANEGLRVSVLCAALREEVKSSAIRDELIAAMEGSDDIMSRSMSVRESLPTLAIDGVGRGEGSPSGGTTGGGLLHGVSTLQLHAAQINLAQQIVVQGAPNATPGPVVVPRADSPARPTPPRDEALLEKLVQPIIDRRYSNRKGYIANHIGIEVPWPRITNMSLVSKLDNGKPHIPYQHFSVVMHKKRRLALFTASNVDASAKARKPDPDRPKSDYSRDGLTGLGENDQELWLTDPRIPEEHQLPDVFYTKDRQSFDKGHIVRREDVCWGRTYAQLRRANGDTFHTTNCSPQVADFNRSNKRGIWGMLENMILKQAKTEKLAVFAGPVFDDEDDEFHGIDERGSVVIQIPRRYWKVVCANNDGQLEVFAFILEQDLSGVALEREFAVDADWVPHMISIPELQDELTGIQFESVLHKADQYDKNHGEEIAAEVSRI